MMQCGAQGCHFDIPEVLTTIDNGKRRLTLCLNHEILLSLGSVRPEEVTFAEGEFKLGEGCDACGEPALQYTQHGEGGFTMHLCQPHLRRLIERSLEPVAWKKLHTLYGDVFPLHDDFYDSEGEALQPKRERAETPEAKLFE